MKYDEKRNISKTRLKGIEEFIQAERVTGLKENRPRLLGPMILWKKQRDILTPELLPVSAPDLDPLMLGHVLARKRPVMTQQLKLSLKRS